MPKPTRSLALAMHVSKPEELPAAAGYLAEFFARLDPNDEYDREIHVGVNTADNGEPPQEKAPIGFASDARGYAIDLTEDEYEEESDG